MVKKTERKPTKKINNLTPEEAFCLDGYIVNGNADMAYMLSRRNDPKANDFNIHRMALKWLRTPHVQAYIEERKLSIFARMEKTEDMMREELTELVGKYKDKDYIIKELVQTSKDMTGKERADVLMRIADLQQMKKEDNKEEEERVHFYVPLPYCKDCPNRNSLVK